MDNSMLATEKKQSEPHFFSGERSRRTGAPKRAGRSVGVLLVCVAVGITQKDNQQSNGCILGWGSGGRLGSVPPVKREALQLPFENYCVIASV